MNIKSIDREIHKKYRVNLTDGFEKSEVNMFFNSTMFLFSFHFVKQNAKLFWTFCNDSNVSCNSEVDS